jgi:hypothetical protein
MSSDLIGASSKFRAVLEDISEDISIVAPLEGARHRSRLGRALVASYVWRLKKGVKECRHKQRPG